MRLTNGDNPLDVVSVAVRHQLLRVWVQAKQLLQAQIGKALGADEEVQGRLTFVCYFSCASLNCRHIVFKDIMICVYSIN